MSVTVVVVDPATQVDAALGFGSEVPRVEEVLCEGAVDPLGFAVGSQFVTFHGASLGEVVQDDPVRFET